MRRRRGRPRLDEPRVNRSIRMSETEWAEVQRQAKEAGMRVSAWVRLKCGVASIGDKSEP